MPRARVNMGQIGRPGLKQFSGVVSEEFLPALQGRNAVKVYDEMASNDPIVNGMLFAVTNLLKRATWRIEPGEGQKGDAGSNESQEVFLIRTALFNDMDNPWPDTVDEILTMLQYGWSWHEIVYKIRKGPNNNPKFNSRYADNMIGWKAFGIRSQKTLDKWEIEPKTGDILGMYQNAPPDYEQVFIPSEKSLLFRTTARYNNPEGRAVLRGAYRPWYFKKNIENLEGVGVERDLVGLPVIEVPADLTSPNASPAEKQQYQDFKDLATRIRRDEQEGIVFPMAYDDDGNKLFNLRLLSKDSSGKKDFDTGSIIARYDQRIAMTMLADFILLGHERVGSFALSANKTRLFAIALESFLESIAAPINRHAIPKLLELNGYDTENPPQLVPGVIDIPNLEELANYINKLFKSNITFTTPADKAFLRRAARMPEVSPEEEEATPVPDEPETTPQENDDEPSE